AGVRYSVSCLGCSAALMVAMVLLGMSRLWWAVILGLIVLVYKLAPPLRMRYEMLLSAALVALGAAYITNYVSIHPHPRGGHHVETSLAVHGPAGIRPGDDHRSGSGPSPRHHDDRDQDRQYQSVQRTALGLRDDREIYRRVL